MGCGAKRRAAAAWVDTQEKSAVRGFLIRWKTVRFSIENRVIAHFVFYAESLRPRKVNKNFGSLKTALWIFLHIRFFHLDCHVVRCLTKT